MPRTGITKQPNGKFRAFVECGYDYDGKRIRKSRVFAKEKEALAWQTQMRCEVERMDMTYYDITLGDLAKKWRKSKEEKRIATSTMLKYDNILRILKEYPQPLYEKKARDIKKHEISTFFNYLAFEKHLSLSYIKNDFKNVISQIFNFGIENDMILKNPCRKAELPNMKEKKSEKDTFTPEEIDIIESNYKNIAFGDIVYMLINTGLRSQEICALDDKSFVTIDGVHHVYVSHAMNKNKTGGWELGDPKTDESERHIPISEEIYTSAMKRIMQNMDHFLLPGRGRKSRVSYDNFNKHYREFFDTLNAVATKKVRYLPPHCCRHTFNSRLIWAGVNPFVIQKLMGHASVKMTDNYAHIMQEHLVSAVAAISTKKAV